VILENGVHFRQWVLGWHWVLYAT